MTDRRLEYAMNRLKSSGIRMTPQRHAILSYLLESLEHPTADEIFKSLESNFPNMSVATVYNNLRVFREVGLVTELTYGDASSRFDANMTDHYHAICNQCGKIVDFQYPVLSDVEQVAQLKTGFAVESHRMEIYGTCEECQRVAAH